MATLNAVIKALDDAGIKPAADKARAVEIRLQSLESDPRLNDNFETALAALIEHHGADALTSLATVMRHYNIKIDSNGCGAVREGAETTHHLFIWEGDEVLEHKWCKEKDIVEITASDIKPEK